MSSFRAKGAQTLGVLTKEVPAWEVETLVISRLGGAVERNGNGAVDMLDFKRKHNEFQLFTHCSTAGPVQPVRKCLVDSWHKKRFGEKCESEWSLCTIWSNEFRRIGTGDEWICRGFLESDWVLLLKPNLKLRKSAMSERLFQEKVAYMRFHDQVHLCCAGLDFGISGWFERDQSIQIVSNDKNQRGDEGELFFHPMKVCINFHKAGSTSNTRAYEFDRKQTTRYKEF